MDEKITLLFLGYGYPLDLEVKWDIAIPTLNKAGFKQVEIDGDVVHIIPKDRYDEVIDIIENINERNDTDITLDFEDVYECDLDEVSER